MESREINGWRGEKKRLRGWRFDSDREERLQDEEMGGGNKARVELRENVRGKRD